MEQRGGAWHADGRYRDGAGRDQRHRAHGPTADSAELRLKAKVAAGEGTQLAATSTVAQLAAYWLHERSRDVEVRASDPEGRAGLAAQSLVRYRADVDSLILRTLGSTLLGELTSPSLDALLKGKRAEIKIWEAS